MQVGFADCVGKVPGVQSILERVDFGTGMLRRAAWKLRAAHPCWWHAADHRSGVGGVLHPRAMSC